MEYIVVGLVVKSWGTGGELKVLPMTDFPERLSPGNTVYADGRPLVIAHSRPHKDHLVIKFVSIDDPTSAGSLRDIHLEIPVTEVRPLPEGEYYRFQIVGLDVWSIHDEPVGKIIGILPTGSNDVYIVHGPDGEILIPAIEDVVKSIDLENHRMVIQLLDGLL